MSAFHDELVSRRRWMAAAAVPVAAAALGRAAPGAAAPGAPPAAGADNLAGARVYNVRDFGAKGDGATLDTAALQSAIDACTADGGGTVLVPGGTFVIGSVELKGNVTLRLAAGATLLGSGDGKQYHGVSAIPLSGDSTLNDGNTGLLFAVNAANVTVEGPGVIDGQGALFRSPAKGAPPPAGISGSHRPYSMLFYRCEHLVIRDVRVVDSAFHAIRIIQSAYVRADGIHVHSRVNHNNDGFHFVSARHVSVANCVVECQDDACALFGSCQYVTVTNCSFSTRWSVFRFGGGNARDIAVSNCVIYQTYGCPIKIRCGPGSVFENMSFSNLIMDDVTGPIAIGVGPMRRAAAAAASTGPAATEPAAASTPAASTAAAATEPSEPGVGRGVLRRISFNNIRATVPAVPPQLPGQPFNSAYRDGEHRSCIALNGVGDAYLEDVSFTDVHVVYGGGGTAEEAARRDVPEHAGEYFELGTLPAYGMYARNVRGLTLRGVRFETLEPDLRPAVVFDHVEDADVNGLNVQGNPAAESSLRLIDSKQALLAASRVLTPAAVFLRVEGAASEGITIDGGDLSKAGAVLACAAGAEEKAVKVRA